MVTKNKITNASEMTIEHMGIWGRRYCIPSSAGVISSDVNETELIAGAIINAEAKFQTSKGDV